MTRQNKTWYVVIERTATFHSASTAEPLQANALYFIIHFHNISLVSLQMAL
jgi:hypothetical protein